MIFSLLLLLVVEKATMKQTLVKFAIIYSFAESPQALFDSLDLLLAANIFHFLVIGVLHSLYLLLKLLAFIIKFFHFLY